VSLKDYLEDVLNKSVDLINYDSMSEKIKKNVEKEVIYLWEEISEN
jgi:predicted nucleotidyltransferase